MIASRAVSRNAHKTKLPAARIDPRVGQYHPNATSTLFAIA